MMSKSTSVSLMNFFWWFFALPFLYSAFLFVLFSIHEYTTFLIVSKGSEFYIPWTTAFSGVMSLAIGTEADRTREAWKWR